MTLPCLSHTPPNIRPADLELLKAYSWPGNIRELENVIERVLIQSKGQNEKVPLRFDLFNSTPKANDERKFSSSDNSVPTLDETMSEHIRRALRLTNGKISGQNGAAQLLGINPNTLRSRMRKLGIPFSANAIKYYEGRDQE